jgi:hypothetical protein
MSVEQYTEKLDGVAAVVNVLGQTDKVSLSLLQVMADSHNAVSPVIHLQLFGRQPCRSSVFVYKT